MSPFNFTVNSLVLYKTNPARVTEVSDKIEIELSAGQRKRVRPKDITLLHSGPLGSLSELMPQQGGNLQEAWELLQGESVPLSDLAELIYGDFTPASVWAAWQVVADGLWFRGEPALLEAISAAERQAELAKRRQKADQAVAWDAFVQRLRQGRLLDEDRKPLAEVERLALGHVEKSHIMRELGHQQSPEHAHRLLIKVGYWQAIHNPFPQRYRVALDEPQMPVPPLPQESRQDLTHLDAFAIDDADSSDADDAVSIDGDRIWVHVADVAALVEAGSELDLQAQTRGANLYLPERIIPMLPHRLTVSMALGMADRSAALSIGFRLDSALKPVDVEIVPSTIRVSCCSYTEANCRLADEPFSMLYQLSQRYRARRLSAGATTLNLPEVKVRVREQGVEISPLPSLDSRQMVTDLMLMAGEAVAGFCQQHGIAAPYATQAAPDQPLSSDSLATMVAYRRHFKPSRLQITPGRHAGLGLTAYCRATSPLRRYSDLLLHQQLRSYLLGRTLLDEKAVSKRLSIAEAASAIVRKTERQSNYHWKLVYLQQNPAWQGEAVLVEQQEKHSSLLIPELAMEIKMRLRDAPELDSRFQLAVREIDLIDGRGHFRVV